MAPSRCAFSGKLQFGSKEEAVAELAILRTLHRPRGRERRVYFCPTCHYYHLTHQRGRRRG